jgi:hypothetical protein
MSKPEKKVAPNTPILCCECGAEFLRANWELTVIAFQVHEPVCQRRDAAQRVAESLGAAV